MIISINKYSLSYIIRLGVFFIIFFCIICIFSIWAAILTIPYIIVLILVSNLFLQKSVYLHKNTLIAPSSGEISNIQKEISLSNYDILFNLYEIQCSLLDHYLHYSPCNMFIEEIYHNKIYATINQKHTIIIEFISNGISNINIIVTNKIEISIGSLIAIMPFGGIVKIYTDLNLDIDKGYSLYAKHTNLYNLT